MKHRTQGWNCALLFVLVLGLSGCAGRGEVYTAGVQALETAGEEPGEAQPGESGTEESTGQDGEAASESEGYVYVCGAVENPGVYPIRAGMRVFEALALAGGFAQDADREWLNQAELLQDGQRLYVYTQEETRAIAEAMQANGQTNRSVVWAEDAGSVGNAGSTGDAGSAGSMDNAEGSETVANAGADGQKVNLNTADREQLKTLPGIGDAKADAIVQYREEHGPFGSIEEIQNISGIKSSIFSKIRDLITV